jgi:hypothetical protein
MRVVFNGIRRHFEELCRANLNTSFLLYFRYSTQAKMVDTGTGNLYIVGSFKRMSSDPDFKVKVIDMHFRGFWCLTLSFDVCISARVVACLLALDDLI